MHIFLKYKCTRPTPWRDVRIGFSNEGYSVRSWKIVENFATETDNLSGFQSFPCYFLIRENLLSLCRPVVRIKNSFCWRNEDVYMRGVATPRFRRYTEEGNTFRPHDRMCERFRALDEHVTIHARSPEFYL